MCERKDGRTDMKPIGTSGDYANASTNISPYIRTLFYLANIVYRFQIASLSYKVQPTPRQACQFCRSYQSVMTRNRQSVATSLVSVCYICMYVCICVCVCVCVYIYIYIYTGCNRRKGQNFGRVFLVLKYTDVTQNTYVQS